MSDYGSRSYGSGSDDNGWGGSGRDGRGFGDSYDDYAPRQRGGSGYGDSGYSSGGGGYADGGYGDGYGGSAGSDSYGSHGASPHDEPVTSGRARVPGGDSTGPGRARGSARVGGKRASGLSEEESEGLKKAKKKKRRRRRLIAMVCVLVMFLGIGTVVGTLFFENVPLPKEIEKELDRNTTITYAGGKKEMGRIGTDFSNRTLVNVREDGKAKEDNDVPKEVQNVLLAMEDRNFYKHDGVDFWGVMRALVNNVTGGETQGASTLTQQYVGTVSKIRNDTSYLRKAKEAVMAMKMDDEYEKYEIIEHYLNLVYMGRGAYGLGAAAKAWFGEKKKVKDLTASEAAIIFAQVKAPDGSFDPMKTEAKDKTAKLEERWEYALDGMVEEGWLKKAKAEEYLKEFPKKRITKTISVTANSGMDKATGFVSHGQVVKEAEERYGLSEQDIKTDGYRIETTINPTLQKIAEKVAKKKDGTAMGDEAENLLGALVAINPRTGEVVAYYGGNDSGVKADKAAEVHAQGSSFKEVTVSAAVDAGWGPESRWDGSSPRKFKERPDGELRNSGDGRGVGIKNVTLREATVKSLNTPMYAISVEVGASTIVKLAQKMGVEKMQVPEVGCDEEECPHVVYPLTGDSKLAKQAQKAIDSENTRSFADHEVSFGQFPVSVVDMASINATLAAQGVHRETHFIKKITTADGEELQPLSKLKSVDALRQEVANDVTDILTGVHPNYLSGNKFDNGQIYAAKSGTWERFCETKCNENSSTSFTGFVPELAAAAWVGDKKNENGSVKTRDGQPAYGAAMAGEVWAMFMQEAVKTKGFDTREAFVKGPGGTGTKESEVGEGEEDGEEDGEDGGNGGGNDDECEEDPTLPQCGGETPPTCEQDPTNPECTGTPDCTVNPTHPQCAGQSPDCDAFPRPPECPDESTRERIRPEYERPSQQDQYAVREDYRKY